MAGAEGGGDDDDDDDNNSNNSVLRKHQRGHQDVSSCGRPPYVVFP